MHQLDGAGSIAAQTRQVDRVAISGISFGIQFVEPLISGSDNHLREVYSFDGVDAHGGSAAFVAAMAAWLRRNDGVDRFFKIYTQDGANLQLRSFVTTNAANIKQARFSASMLHGGKNVQISADTLELHDDLSKPKRSIALLPHAYWEQLPPAREGTLDDHGQPMQPAMRLYDTVHHIIAACFANNAIQTSGFRDP